MKILTLTGIFLLSAANSSDCPNPMPNSIRCEFSATYHDGWIDLNNTGHGRLRRFVAAGRQARE